MIESIQVRNFQCHSKFAIELDEHVTTIIGPSDVGKSSIIRALRWACTNIPAGDAFIQDGKTRCGVRLKMDGKVVERTKGTGENNYKLNGKAYKSFGSNAPEPIVNFLNLSPVTWQGQHDSPFWLAETAGQVGRELNAVVNLESMDAALSAVNQMVAKGKARQDAAQERLRSTQERLEGLGWVEEAKGDMGELEAACASYEVVQATFVRLQPLYNEIVQEHNRLDGFRHMWKAAEKVESYGAVVVVVQDQLDKLSSIIEEGEGLQVVEVPNMTYVIQSAVRMGKTQATLDAMQEVVRKHMLAGETVRICFDKVREAEGELTGELEGRCPLCGAEAGDLL